MGIMTNPVKAALLLSTGAALGMLLTLSQGVFAGRETTSELPLSELQTFVEILNRVQQDYVEQVDDDTLLESAIRGMLSGLDPHSAYLEADEFKDITISTSGKFGGLGIEVQGQNGFVRVIARTKIKEKGKIKKKKKKRKKKKKKKKKK